MKTMAEVERGVPAASRRRAFSELGAGFADSVRFLGWRTAGVVAVQVVLLLSMVPFKNEVFGTAPFYTELPCISLWALTFLGPLFVGIMASRHFWSTSLCRTTLRRQEKPQLIGRYLASCACVAAAGIPVATIAVVADLSSQLSTDVLSYASSVLSSSLALYGSGGAFTLMNDKVWAFVGIVRWLAYVACVMAFVWWSLARSSREERRHPVCAAVGRLALVFIPCSVALFILHVFAFVFYYSSNVLDHWATLPFTVAETLLCILFAWLLARSVVLQAWERGVGHEAFPVGPGGRGARVAFGVCAGALAIVCALVVISPGFGRSDRAGDEHVQVDPSLMRAAEESQQADYEGTGVICVEPSVIEVPASLGAPLRFEGYLDVARELDDSIYTVSHRASKGEPIEAATFLRAMLSSGQMVTSREELLQVTGLDRSDEEIIAEYEGPWGDTSVGQVEELMEALGMLRGAIAIFDDAFFAGHDLVMVSISVNSNGATFVGSVTDGETLCFCFEHGPDPLVSDMLARYETEVFAIPKGSGDDGIRIISWKL